MGISKDIFRISTTALLGISSVACTPQPQKDNTDPTSQSHILAIKTPTPTTAFNQAKSGEYLPATPQIVTADREFLNLYYPNTQFLTETQSEILSTQNPHAQRVYVHNFTSFAVDPNGYEELFNFMYSLGEVFEQAQFTSERLRQVTQSSIIERGVPEGHVVLIDGTTPFPDQYNTMEQYPAFTSEEADGFFTVVRLAPDSSGNIAGLPWMSFVNLALASEACHTVYNIDYKPFLKEVLPPSTPWAGNEIMCVSFGIANLLHQNGLSYSDYTQTSQKFRIPYTKDQQQTVPPVIFPESIYAAIPQINLLQ